MVCSENKKARQSESDRARGEGVRELFGTDTAKSVLQCVVRECHELAVSEVDSRTLGFDCRIVA
ncbi:hypothetical protein WS85_14640 [Burkholderia anthina]|nr:hypothetical protein WS85_14640 [Burkholderia anthina]KVX34791.1 hypothetical protein WT32_18475 [Burkholderia anthina]